MSDVRYRRVDGVLTSELTPEDKELLGLADQQWMQEERIVDERGAWVTVKELTMRYMRESRPNGWHHNRR